MRKVRIFWEGHKIWKNLPHKIWRYTVTSNFKWKIFSNFVAFSVYPNFRRIKIIKLLEFAMKKIHLKHILNHLKFVNIHGNIFLINCYKFKKLRSNCVGFLGLHVHPFLIGYYVDVVWYGVKFLIWVWHNFMQEFLL